VRLRLAALLAVLVSLVPAAPAAAVDAQQLRARLTQDIRAAGASSGAYARDLDSGRDLVAVRAGTDRIPASVEKLYTTAAALLRLGPEGVLETTAVADGLLTDAGVLRGDLVLVGGGDPTLDDAGLRRLARDVRAAGIERVTGAVVGDETAFDLRRGTPRTGANPDPDLGGRLGALVMDRGYQTTRR
jgi:D-alanyl-D-alanine carboxypeptidase/D-alanyl-D-alanine-endopeptidase (penicillin-binding protein 4)